MSGTYGGNNGYICTFFIVVINVKDNPNAGIGNWVVNPGDMFEGQSIEGQSLPLSVQFVNDTVDG